MALATEMKVTKDTRGKIVSAEGVGDDGAPLRLTVSKGATDPTRGPKGSYGTVKITRAAAPLLEVMATISPASKSVSFKAVGEGVAVNWTMDLSGFDASHHAVVSGQAGGNEFKGTFDPRPGRGASAVGVPDWMPAATAKQLVSLRPVLETMANELQTRAAEHAEAMEKALTKGSWSTVGHAVCWGLGGMGAAAACVASAGLGCVAAGAGFSAAASYCADQY